MPTSCYASIEIRLIVVEANYKWAHYIEVYTVPNYLLSFILYICIYKSFSIFVGGEVIQEPFLSSCQVLVIDRGGITGKQRLSFSCS